MDSINSFLLGITQGLTEFLPISSSGHLVLGQHFLGIEHSGILLEVVLHLGTLLSILLYYCRDISNLLHGISKRDSESLHYAFILVDNYPILLGCPGEFVRLAAQHLLLITALHALLLLRVRELFRRLHGRERLAFIKSGDAES